MNFMLLFFVFALVENGCVPIQEVRPLPRSEQFRAEDLVPYAEKGTSSIIGEAFLKTRGGSVKKGAGETVF